MKKVVFIFLLITVVFLFFKAQNRFKPVEEKKTSIKQIKPKKIKPTTAPLFSKEKQAVFVPYWAKWQEADFSEYDRIIYFGVTADRSGVVKNDLGYKKLKHFDKLWSTDAVGQRPLDAEKWLALRLTETEVNLPILKDSSSWKKIIRDLENIVKKYQFKGVVLDLELSSIADNKTINQVNGFVQYLYTKTKGYSDNVKLALILHGDTFYRKRPYDLKSLSQKSDEIMIMAYDFHKKRGEPGPNFPLQGKKKYGYDMETMINDFLKDASQEKLTVVFGMFGYDWLVDEKKRPIRKGKALTLNEIQKQFLDNCQWKNCLVKRDDLSQETEVNYIKSEVVDDYGYLYPHIVWFEDQRSVSAKKAFLKKRGIRSFALWAWGYF